MDSPFACSLIPKPTSTSSHQVSSWICNRQGWAGIFEWCEGQQDWFWYDGDFPQGWEKKVKISNAPPSTSKKSSTYRSTKPKSAKKSKGVATSTPTVCFDIVPYGEKLPPIGNIVLDETPLVLKTRIARKSTIVNSKPPLPKQPLDATPSSRTNGSKRKISPKASTTQLERKVCLLNTSLFLSLAFPIISLVANLVYMSLLLVQVQEGCHCCPTHCAR